MSYDSMKCKYIIRYKIQVQNENKKYKYKLMQLRQRSSSFAGCVKNSPQFLATKLDIGLLAILGWLLQRKTERLNNEQAHKTLHSNVRIGFEPPQCDRISVVTLLNCVIVNCTEV